MSTTKKPQVGDRGTYRPKAGNLAQERAEIVHVWTDTCVDLKTDSGVMPAGVLIVADPAARDAPAGYFFVPDEVVDAEFKPQSLEDEIAEKASKAPRVTPADIEAEIASEHYFTAANGHCGAYAAAKYSIDQEGEPSVVEVLEVPKPLELLTFCVLVLKNGFTVTGESACASPENFDAEIGRKVARAAAVSKVWPLLGFRLRDKLAADH